MCKYKQYIHKYSTINPQISLRNLYRLQQHHATDCQQEQVVTLTQSAYNSFQLWQPVLWQKAVYIGQFFLLEEWSILLVEKLTVRLETNQGGL